MLEIYIIDECFRIDGSTGKLIEEEYQKDFEKYQEEISLHGMRNGYVSFQVIIDYDNAQKNNIDVKFSDLKGDGVISQKEYEAFTEWFHDIKGKYIPDALIPYNKVKPGFNPIDDEYLSKQRISALWVDLFIPEMSHAGEYSGELKVTVGDFTKSFKISVKVYDTVLPDESSIYADLNCYAESISQYYPELINNEERFNDGTYFEVEKEFFKLAHEHRSVFHYLGYKHSGRVVESFAPDLEGEGNNIAIKSWEKFDRHFESYLDGTAFKESKRGEVPVPFLYMPFNLNWPASYEKWGKKGYKTEIIRIAREFIKHFEEKGWRDTYFELFLNHKKRYRSFPYDGDETRFIEDESLMDYFYGICKDAFEGTEIKFINRVDSSWNYGRHFKSKYADLINMWVVGRGIMEWFPESMDVMAKKGNIHFVYGSLSGLDQPLASVFTWPMMCIATGLRGFTFWNSIGFGEEYLRTPLSNGTQAIMYPGVHFGLKAPIPSIRLKVLRNSVQTADLMSTVWGSNKQDKVVSIINSNYGEDSSFWWNEKPGFVNDLPHTWTNTKISEACKISQYVGKSPIVMKKITRDVLTILDRGERDV